MAVIQAAVRIKLPTRRDVVAATRLDFSAVCSSITDTKPKGEFRFSKYGRRGTQIRYFALGKCTFYPGQEVTMKIAPLFGLLEEQFVRHKDEFLGIKRRNFPHYSLGIFVFMCHLDPDNFLFYCQATLPIYKTINILTKILAFYETIMKSACLSHFPIPAGIVEAHRAMAPTPTSPGWKSWTVGAKVLLAHNPWLDFKAMRDPFLV